MFPLCLHNLSFPKVNFEILPIRLYDICYAHIIYRQPLNNYVGKPPGDQMSQLDKAKRTKVIAVDINCIRCKSRIFE